MRTKSISIRVRRAAVGSLAGIVPGLVLATAVAPAPFGLVLGPVVGGLYAVAFPPGRGTALDHALGAAALGIPLWILIQILAVPLVTGTAPAWSPDGMRGLLPGFVAWVLAGVVYGVLLPVAGSIVERRYGPEPSRTKARKVEKRIVVLGGGFAGLSTAQHLEQLFGPDPSVEMTLVSETNAILFTPMLSEVAAGSVEPTHITSPLRTSLRRTRVIWARITGVDLEKKQVLYSGSRLRPLDTNGEGSDGPSSSDAEASSAAPNAQASGALETLPYDHLVLTLGSVPDHKGLENVRKLAFDFKTLQDAIWIRNHVITCFERADREEDPAKRQALVTFVIAGAGFAGAELAGALNDFARGMLVYYPNIPPQEVKVVVVQMLDRILPELSGSLAGYAKRRMEERGVTFRLGARIMDARPGVVILDAGEEIRAETLVWTAGNRPHPLLGAFEIDRDRIGAAIVDPYLAVPGHTDVWAAGDCAAVTDARSGKRCPPTAQHALRQARVVAGNIHAAVRGGKPKRFSYRALGSLCVVGHHTACAEIRGLRFSGLFAWLLWRAVYLAKLPGLERKIRVLVDWVVELFFPRDIVQTVDLETRRQI